MNQDTAFNQLCVWPGTIVHEGEEERFNTEISEELGCRVKYEGQIVTRPDKDEYGADIYDTGGRNDLLFYVHQEDIGKFAILRLEWDMKWFEDMMHNYPHIYKKEDVEKYISKTN